MFARIAVTVRAGDYLTLEAVQQLVQEAGYLSVGEMQRLCNKEGAPPIVVYRAHCAIAGEYLTLAEMQHLVEEAGYMTAAELHALLSAN